MSVLKIATLFSGVGTPEQSLKYLNINQLYKQAGNGMSRNILDMIFTQIFKYYKII